jgi:hypothetical protein
MASASVLSFNFRNDLALRIANLITGDIERLEKDAFGTQTNWQTKFERPFKAHYANALVDRTSGNPRAGELIKAGLPAYEARAAAYSANPQKKGRPLTTFINRDDSHQIEVNTPEVPPPELMQLDGDIELANELAEILGTPVQSNVPVPQGRTSPQRAGNGEAKAPERGHPHTGRTQTHEPIVEVYTDTPAAQQAIAALMAALTPKSQPIDEEQVRAIARDEAKKTVQPTVVHIQPSNAELPVIDMGVQHTQFATLVKVLQTRFPVWLPGPAGSGKTTAARNAATALSVAFHHTGAVDNVYQLLGFIDAGGTYHRTTFREAYENGGVFLWDEVDASNPAALVAFNAALENGECVFPDAVISKHADCYFIAAANTYGTGATHEYVGRTKIDAATVDRFIMLDWAYDEILERAIAGDNQWTTYVQAVRRAVVEIGIKHLVTPRASIRGNALLAAGVHRDHVIAMTVRKGLSDDNWRSVSGRVRV